MYSDRIAALQTPQNHDTWRRFYHAAMQLWDKHQAIIHPAFRHNIHRLTAFAEGIPGKHEVDAVLAPIGWRCKYVDGLAPAWEIASLIDQQMLPISLSIRSPDETFFAREPDLIHDIFGHLPVLFDAEYRALLKRWSSVASSLAIEESDRAGYHINKLIVTLHDRIDVSSMANLKSAARNLGVFARKHQSRSLIFEKAYFWIFEFGMLMKPKGPQVLGAGLLSSLREMENIAQAGFSAQPLNHDTLLSNYNISEEQDFYLVSRNLQELRKFLDDLAVTYCPASSAEELSCA